MTRLLERRPGRQPGTELWVLDDGQAPLTMPAGFTPGRVRAALARAEARVAAADGTSTVTVATRAKHTDVDQAAAVRAARVERYYQLRDAGAGHRDSADRARLRSWPDLLELARLMWLEGPEGVGWPDSADQPGTAEARR